MFHYAQHFSTFSGRTIMSHIWFCQYYFRYKNEQVEFSKHTKTWISIWMWENWNLKCYCCDHNDGAFTLKRFRRWSTKTDSHNLFAQSLEWELVHLNTKVSFIVMTKSVRKHTTGELIIVKIPIFQWCYCYCHSLKMKNALTWSTDSESLMTEIWEAKRRKRDFYDCRSGNLYSFE